MFFTAGTLHPKKQQSVFELLLLFAIAFLRGHHAYRQRRTFFATRQNRCLRKRYLVTLYRAVAVDAWRSAFAFSSLRGFSRLRSCAPLSPDSNFCLAPHGESYNACWRLPHLLWLGATLETSNGKNVWWLSSLSRRRSFLHVRLIWHGTGWDKGANKCPLPH